MAKLCWAECIAQKAKKKVEEKVKEKAERQRVVKEKKRKRRTVEYLQQLRDKVLKEEAEGSQVTGSKCKEVATRDEKGQWPSKKARGKQPGKYCRGAAAKMRGV